MAGAKGRSGGDRTSRPLSPIPDSKRPRKPTKLSKRASHYWDMVIGQIPDNVLTPIDGHELRILSNLLAQSEHLEFVLNDDPDNDKAQRLYLNVFKEIHRLSSCFGLNPADRQRLDLTTNDDEPDPFLEFLAMARNG